MVDHQGDEAVGALEVAAREVGVRGGLTGHVGGVGRRPSVERLVDSHVQREAEPGKLGRAERERAPLRAQQRAERKGAHHDPRRHELRAKPGEGAEQREAGKRIAPGHPLVQADRKQRGPRERGSCGQLGVDRAAVGEKGRREPEGQGRPERPGIGHGP